MILHGDTIAAREEDGPPAPMQLAADRAGVRGCDDLAAAGCGADRPGGSCPRRALPKRGGSGQDCRPGAGQ